MASKQPVSGVLAEMLRLARSCDYFQCLRLARDASTTEVKDAWLHVVAELKALESLQDMTEEEALALKEVTQVFNDAFEVLSDPDLRLAYRLALES